MHSNERGTRFGTSCIGRLVFGRGLSPMNSANTMVRHERVRGEDGREGEHGEFR
jgi:hypothetical protein